MIDYYNSLLGRIFIESCGGYLTALGFDDGVKRKSVLAARTNIHQDLFTIGSNGFSGAPCDKGIDIAISQLSGCLRGNCDACYSRGKCASTIDLTKRWLDTYFSGKPPNFTPDILLKGTAFQKLVYSELLKTPYGVTSTYGSLGKRVALLLGRRAMSAQAIGGALGANSVAIVIPCHRVIGADGSLTGYAYGLDKKRALLECEGVL